MGTSTIANEIPAQPDAGTVVVDCDVHSATPDGLKSIMPYMESAWRKRFERKRATFAADSLSLRYGHPNGRVIRVDAVPPRGGPGGSDPGHLVADHIEPNGISCVIVNTLQALGHAVVLGGPDESIAICQAFNDFHFDQWLPVDSRIRYAATVPVQDPIAAARETERVAAVDGVAAIAVPMIATFVGNRYYHPIYEAAEACGLPIVLHVSGTDFLYQGAPAPAGGITESYAERFVTMAPTIGMSNLTNLVFSGTLERFPELRFAFLEFGFGWVAPLLTRMDSAWRELRHEIPWVTRPPSEYVREQVRFSTQPSDEAGEGEEFKRNVNALGAAQLVFSSDYPHWDNDMPRTTLRGLGPEVRDRIFATNAIEFFGAGRLGLA